MADPTPIETRPGQSAGRPRRKQLLVLIGGGALLAFGGCAFFAAMGTQSSRAISAIGALVFVAGVLMILAGGLWALVIGARRLFKK
jgi:hypothetical protein